MSIFIYWNRSVRSSIRTTTYFAVEVRFQETRQQISIIETSIQDLQHKGPDIGFCRWIGWIKKLLPFSPKDNYLRYFSYSASFAFSVHNVHYVTADPWCCVLDFFVTFTFRAWRFFFFFLHSEVSTNGAKDQTCLSCNINSHLIIEGGRARLYSSVCTHWALNY